MKKAIVLVVIFYILLTSCGTSQRFNFQKKVNHYLEIDCSEIEAGWCAVIFYKSTYCDSTIKNSVCKLDKNGFAFTKSCFLNKNIFDNYLFFDSKNRKDNLFDTIGRKRILAFHLSTFDKYQAITFYIGKQSSGTSDLSLNTSEYWAFEQKMDVFVGNLN